MKKPIEKYLKKKFSEGNFEYFKIFGISATSHNRLYYFYDRLIIENSKPIKIYKNIHSTESFLFNPSGTNEKLEEQEWEDKYKELYDICRKTLDEIGNYFTLDLDYYIYYFKIKEFIGEKARVDAIRVNELGTEKPLIIKDKILDIAYFISFTIPNKITEKEWNENLPQT